MFALRMDNLLLGVEKASTCISEARSLFLSIAPILFLAEFLETLNFKVARKPSISIQH